MAISKIDIKGEKYKIFYVDALDNAVGECCKSTRTIKVLNTLSQKEKDICLLHELGHALFNEIALDQTVPLSLEQIIVENYANMIYKLFKNKLLSKN